MSSSQHSSNDPFASAPQGLSFKGVRRSVYGNLILLVLFLAVPLVLVILWGTRQTQSQLSRDLINSVTSRAHSELNAFFDPIRQNLMAARAWGLSGALDVSGYPALNQLFIPILAQNHQISSLLIGNENGDEYLLLRDGETWRNRLSRAEEWGQRRRWLRFDADGTLLEDYWDEVEYDTRQRPWFEGALSRPEGLMYWTEPYSFHTTGEAGMTASIQWKPPGEEAVSHVVAMDVLLKDISAFTTRYRVSEGGQLAVLTGDGRVFGLPTDPRFESEAAINDSVLKTPQQLGIPDLAKAYTLWSSSALPMERPYPFRSEGRRVWSGFRPFDMGSKRRLWIAVTVPEADFVGEVRRQNLIIAGVTAGGLLLALLLGLLMERGVKARMREEMSARQLGQYTLEEKLGEGGMGTVYRARHQMLRRPTAVKLLRPEKEGDEEAIARFEREVQLTSQLTHPNTVAIFDYGRTPEGVFYYAMEYFDGIDVEQLVETYGPVQPERAVHILRQVCGSLAEAHDFGLIHRDIKPANIMLCERGGMLDVVKVLDFGMVKDVSMGSQKLDLTQQNVVMGTPMFLAPEAILKRDDVDGRSDLYAVGAVAYFMLTGRNVFDGKTVIDIVREHLEAEPVPPTKLFPGLPADLEQIVLDCLAKAPRDRPENARVLIERLENCSVGRRWDQRLAAEWWKSHSGEVPKTVAGVHSDQVQLTVQLPKT